MSGAMIDLGAIDPRALPASAADWLASLPESVGFRVVGRGPGPPVAVVTLLHGNEPSGARAVHRLLRDGVRPAVDAIVVLGAIDCARIEPGPGRRHRPGGRDLNRCFAPPFAGPEGRRARSILEFVRAGRPRWLVDLHNNSGHNPSYGVVGSLDPPRRGLVAAFAGRAVLSHIRLGSLVEVLDGEIPAVTIECGRAGDPAADRAAARGLERLLVAPDRLPAGADLEVFTAPVRFHLRAGISLAFGHAPVPGAGLTFDRDVDRHNFRTLEPGTRIGWLAPGAPWPLVASDEQGRDVSRHYFAARGGALETHRALVPMMMTTDPEIARSDCLFYVADPPGPRVPGP